MQIRAEVARITTTKGEGGIDVAIQIRFIAGTGNDLGMLFELLELQNQQVLITMEGIQQKLDFDERRGLKES